MNFKDFIINEHEAYLAQKVGDILTSLQELRDDAKHMGSRELVRYSEKIVNQIRSVLHSNWPREEKKHLLTLQKVGVALMKSIEEKENLPEMISGSAAVIEKLVARLGIPIHKLADTDKPDDEGGTDKSANDTPPPEPVTVDKASPDAAPPNRGPDASAKPLGGSSGPLDAF